jgi:hypothetical protein
MESPTLTKLGFLNRIKNFARDAADPHISRVADSLVGLVENASGNLDEVGSVAKSLGGTMKTTAQVTGGAYVSYLLAKALTNAYKAKKAKTPLARVKEKWPEALLLDEKIRDIGKSINKKTGLVKANKRNNRAVGAAVTGAPLAALGFSSIKEK